MVKHGIKGCPDAAGLYASIMDVFGEKEFRVEFYPEIFDRRAPFNGASID